MSKRRTSKIEEDLTCSICLKRFTDPVSLICGHIFCKNCLISIDRNSYQIRCPECRRECPINQLIPAYRIRSLVTNIKELSGTQEIPGSPRLLVYQDAEGTLQLNMETVQICFVDSQIEDYPLCLLSVIGEKRCGKSFLMNYILRAFYNQERGAAIGPDILGDQNERLTGFQWQNGEDSVTKGIWIWDRLFKLERNNEKMAVFILDTEGSLDTDGNQEISNKLSALSMFLSSYMIFNVNKILKTTELDLLEIYDHIQECLHSFVNSDLEGSSTERSSTAGSSTERSSTAGSSTERSSTERSSTAGSSTERSSTAGSSTEGSSTEGSSTEGSSMAGSSTERSSMAGSSTEGSSTERSSMAESSTEGSSMAGSSTEGSSTERSSMAGSSTEGSSMAGSSTEGSSTEGSSMAEGSSTEGSSTDGHSITGGLMTQYESLDLLVRDWNIPEECGRRAGRRYLDHEIRKLQKSNQRNRIIQVLNEQSVRSFLLPHPGNRFLRSREGNLEAMDEDFRHHLTRYICDLLTTIWNHPKKDTRGNPIKCGDLILNLEKFVHFLNRKEFNFGSPRQMYFSIQNFYNSNRISKKLEDFLKNKDRPWYKALGMRPSKLKSKVEAEIGSLQSEYRRLLKTDSEEEKTSLMDGFKSELEERIKSFCCEYEEKYKAVLAGTVGGVALAAVGGAASGVVAGVALLAEVAATAGSAAAAGALACGAVGGTVSAASASLITKNKNKKRNSKNDTEPPPAPENPTDETTPLSVPESREDDTELPSAPESPEDDTEPLLSAE